MDSASAGVLLIIYTLKHQNANQKILGKHLPTGKRLSLKISLSGGEITLKDITELPPTAGRRDFVLQRKIWFTASYKFAVGKLA